MTVLTRGYDVDGLGGIAREAFEQIEAIVSAKIPPAEKLERLDALFMTASTTKRIAIREAAFLRLCGVRQ